jgi:O-methyltransferase
MNSSTAVTKTSSATAISLANAHHVPRRTWMKYERAQRIVSRTKLLRRLTIGLFAQVELLILKGHKDRSTVASIRRCRRGTESLLTGNEAFLLHSLATAQCSFGCAMAELGVYRGSSARIICEAKGNSALHLFDTFSGLPDPGAGEQRVFTEGQYAASLSSVRSVLSVYSGVHFHPGIFPQSAGGLDALRFSLVHLDADLYASTLAGLEFFYPRMIPSGIIITHDFSTLPGVARAFSEFSHKNGRAIIELPTTQAMVVV